MRCFSDIRFPEVYESLKNSSVAVFHITPCVFSALQQAEKFARNFASRARSDATAFEQQAAARESVTFSGPNRFQVIVPQKCPDCGRIRNPTNFWM
jgi:hypothetical protein